MRHLLLAGLILLQSSLAASVAGPFEHELRMISDDVFVAVRPNVNRLPVTGNITFIINRDDVVVVDSGGTPAAAEDAIGLLRTKTDLPVTAVINTHWHGDHHLGNSAWLAQWPDVEFIAHAGTDAAMRGEPMSYLKQQTPESLRAAGETFAARVETGLDGEGKPLSETERGYYREAHQDLPLIAEQMAVTHMVLPTRTFENQLVLDRPGRRIEIRHLGRGNTDGDAIVYLPDDGVVITGDLVVMPVPYGFYSYPGDWIETLGRIKALEWSTLVPGHGEPQQDAQYLDTLVMLLETTRRQVAAGARAGKSLEQIRAEMDFGAAGERIVAGDALRARLFRSFWIMPITRSAWKEAHGVEIVQGKEPT